MAESGEVEGARTSNSSEIGAGQRAARGARKRATPINGTPSSSRSGESTTAGRRFPVQRRTISGGRGRRFQRQENRNGARTARTMTVRNDFRHAAMVICTARGERRGATARWRVARPIDPRRDNNGGQGVVTSTKLDDAMYSDGFKWIFGVDTSIEGHGEVYVK
ncbi:hypothetical protein Scep_005252 [Stephania cephalantha]|uniref:Uncharacterized protein n=1 Tax=Stephania cephalantha TaxID=152367 RepID=A0AAP0PW66_9MAGN